VPVIKIDSPDDRNMFFMTGAIFIREEKEIGKKNIF